MTGGGSIVLIGSIADSIGTPGYTVYNASKAAVRSFSRTWTNELAARNIRINTLSPGPIDTPLLRGGYADELGEAIRPDADLGALRARIASILQRRPLYAGMAHGAPS